MKAPLTRLWQSFALTLLATGFCLGLAGCGATKPSSASFASVTIQNRSVVEIRNAVGEVFSAKGYRVLYNGNEMMMQREGSRATQAAFGGLAEDTEVDIRVRANIVELTPTTHRLDCKAYAVRDPGDPTFEEETRLSNLRSRPYQELLDQVAEKLK